MELSDSVKTSENDPYMQFNITDTSMEYQNQTVKVSEVEPKDGYYVFKCRIAAKDINSTITAQLIDGDKESNPYEYSVKQYANYLIAHQSESAEFAKAVPLVEAMLTYGDYAVNYFNKEANPLDSLDETVIPNGYALTDTDNLPDGVTFDSATLSLKSQTTLSLYFKSAEPLTLTCEGREVVTESSDNDYVIRIRNIPAADLNKPIKVMVNGTHSVTYTPLTYCYKAQSSNSVKLVNTVKALYNYWNAAYNYFVIPNSKEIIFTDSKRWGDAYMYAWDSDGAQLTGVFPGSLQYEKSVNDYGEIQFVFYIPNGAAGVVVSNGAGEQTENITDFSYTGYWMNGDTDGLGHYKVTGWN